MESTSRARGLQVLLRPGGDVYVSLELHAATGVEASTAATKGVLPGSPRPRLPRLRSTTELANSAERMGAVSLHQPASVLAHA